MNFETTQKKRFNVSFYDFFTLLVTDEKFRELICNIFKDCEYNNVYWEFPGINKTNMNNKAEFVIIKTNSFAKSNHMAFSEYFDDFQNIKIIQFKNSSKDCDLITPTPINNKNYYNSCSDIMTFFKSAFVPEELLHQLLITIGSTMLKYLNANLTTSSNQKKYLSTSGRGVQWLHVRICNTPRYYNHEEYVKT